MVRVGLRRRIYGKYCCHLNVSSFKVHTPSTESGLRRICQSNIQVGASGHHVLLVRRLIGQFLSCDNEKILWKKKLRLTRTIKRKKSCQSTNCYSDKYIEWVIAISLGVLSYRQWRGERFMILLACRTSEITHRPVTSAWEGGSKSWSVWKQLNKYVISAVPHNQTRRIVFIRFTVSQDKDIMQSNLLVA